jgi:hypothetical protein
MDKYMKKHIYKILPSQNRTDDGTDGGDRDKVAGKDSRKKGTPRKEVRSRR